MNSSVDGWQRLPHYQAAQVCAHRQRFYEVEGERYPGVTKILSATKPAADRQALWQWKARIGQEEAQKITSSASSVGTRLHKIIRQHLNQEAVEIPEDLEGYWRSLLPVISEVETVLLVEGAVWHPDGFLGFPDALVVRRGQLCLCDWKTARKPKRREWIEDYCLQVAAYAAAVDWVYREQEIQVEQAVVAIALNETKAQIFQLTSKELKSYQQQFQQRLALFYDQTPFVRHSGS